MSDDDDYLSDKFLFGDPSTSASSSKSTKSKAKISTPSAPKTYSELRRESLRKSEAKNLSNRKKSQKEGLTEGLSTSLFERAKEDEERGLGKNKALGMMMKMGFKPGQSLGRETPLSTDDNDGREEEDNENVNPGIGSKRKATSEVDDSPISGHRAEPISINFWGGESKLFAP